MKGRLRVCGHLTVMCTIRLYKLFLTPNLMKAFRRKSLTVAIALYKCSIYNNLHKDRLLLGSSSKRNPWVLFPGWLSSHDHMVTDSQKLHLGTKYLGTWPEWPHPLLTITWAWWALGKSPIYLWSVLRVHSTAPNSVKNRAKYTEEPIG